MSVYCVVVVIYIKLSPFLLEESDEKLSVRSLSNRLSSNNNSRQIAPNNFNKRSVSSMTFKEENIGSYTDANGILYKLDGKALIKS